MIQFLRGTKSTLEASQQVFSAGQPIFESDSGQLKIGNGADVFSNLPYVGSSSAESSFVQGSDSLCWVDIGEGVTWVKGQFYYSLGHSWSSSSVYDVQWMDYDMSRDISNAMNSAGLSLRTKIFWSEAHLESTSADIITFVQSSRFSISNNQIAANFISYWLPVNADPPRALTKRLIYTFVMYD